MKVMILGIALVIIGAMIASAFGIAGYVTALYIYSKGGGFIGIMTQLLISFIGVAIMAVFWSRAFVEEN